MASVLHNRGGALLLQELIQVTVRAMRARREAMVSVPASERADVEWSHCAAANGYEIHANANEAEGDVGLGRCARAVGISVRKTSPDGVHHWQLYPPKGTWGPLPAEDIDTLFVLVAGVAAAAVKPPRRAEATATPEPLSRVVYVESEGD